MRLVKVKAVAHGRGVGKLVSQFVNPDHVLYLFPNTPDIVLIHMVGGTTLAAQGDIEEIAVAMRGTSQRAEKVLEAVSFWWDMYGEDMGKHNEICVEEEELYAAAKKWKELDD